MSLRYAAALVLLSLVTYSQTIEQARAIFVSPPADARIMMRWWWFGPSVTNAELESELRRMQFMGIGGVEIQPVYPLVLDDPKARYLSDDYLAALRFTANKTRELGLRMDITLGSGWPFGGPHVPISEAAGRLRVDRVVVPAATAGVRSIAMPDVGAGEHLLAIFAAKSGDGKRFNSDGLMRLDSPSGPRLNVPSGANLVLFFIASRTGQQVKRAAIGAEGFVLDHYNRRAIENHLRVVGDRLMTAFGDKPPYSVFSDSLEVYGSDWTADLPIEFNKRRGYDLIDLLPALVDGFDGTIEGHAAADIRHDWGLTLTELCNERYLTPIREWARKNGTRFRSQTYGIPPVTLSSNALVDLPEGEHGPYWRTFSAARWAASASHLYGRPVTSSETWTWLHSPVFRATPLDMKAEADLHFLQGINQLVGHGWPYSPEQAGEPGWRFYAAAVFNHHNPWWQVMPDVSRYLQRVSALLRLGKPANDVALYLPTHDAYAQFKAGGRTSIDQAMEGLLDPKLIPQILEAGYNFDFIDDGAIGTVGIPYPALVIPNLKRMPEATARLIEDYRRRGGIVVDLRRDSFEALHATLPSDFETGVKEIGFIHRKLDNGDVYFVANTGNTPVRTFARVRAAEANPQLEWWDPGTARAIAAVVAEGKVAVDLEPYESRVLICSKNAGAHEAPLQGSSVIADLTPGWRVTFTGTGQVVSMDRLRSWTDDQSTLYYSGAATYERSFSNEAQPGKRVFLNFGKGVPIDAPKGRTQGFAALLDPPVREAAMVLVNGKLAGTVWHPPYEIEITALVKSGMNQLRIFVSNTALNGLAGQTLPDYKLLNLRYGERFSPQDMDNVKPLPSGLLGRITLIAR